MFDKRRDEPSNGAAGSSDFLEQGERLQARC